MHVSCMYCTLQRAQTCWICGLNLGVFDLYACTQHPQAAINKFSFSFCLSQIRRNKRLSVVQRRLVLRSCHQQLGPARLHWLHPCRAGGSRSRPGRRCHVHLWRSHRRWRRSRRPGSFPHLLTPVVHLPEHGALSLAAVRPQHDCHWQVYCCAWRRAELCHDHRQ